MKTFQICSRRTIAPYGTFRARNEMAAIQALATQLGISGELRVERSERGNLSVVCVKPCGDGYAEIVAVTFFKVPPSFIRAANAAFRRRLPDLVKELGK